MSSITVHLSAEEVSTLHRLSTELKVSQAQVMRDALKEYGRDRVSLHDRVMMAYAVACKYGHYEALAFKLVDEMFACFSLPTATTKDIPK